MINPEPEVFGHPQISYRRLQPSDLDTLKRIHDELFPTRLDPDFYPDVVDGRNNIVSWGAVDSSRQDGQSDEIIGYVTAEVTNVGQSEIADMVGDFYAELDDTVVYVMTLGVVHKYRNLGIATSLLREVITYASDLPNCQAVYLHAMTINKPAVKLYKKMSFKCVKRLRRYYPIHGDYFDAFLFILYLKPEAHHCSPLLFREVVTSIYSYMVSGMKSVSPRQ